MLPLTASVFFGGWLLSLTNTEKKALLENYKNGGFDAAQAEEKRKTLQPNLYAYNGTKLEQKNNYNGTLSYSDGVDAVMVIPIRGVMTKEDQPSGSYGMDAMAEWIQAAYENDNILAVVIDMFTPGGSVAGVEALGNIIAQKTKPVIVFANDLVASAGYWVSAGADVIIASGENAQIGSIGAYVSFLDDTQYLADNGLKVIDVYATQSSEKNADIRQYFDEGKLEKLQKRVDTYAGNFISHVKKNRPQLKYADNPTTLEGAMFFAKEAKKVGLIDDIGTFSQALDVAFKMGKKKKRAKNSVMA